MNPGQGEAGQNQDPPVNWVRVCRGVQSSCVDGGKMQEQTI